MRLTIDIPDEATIKPCTFYFTVACKNGDIEVSSKDYFKAKFGIEFEIEKGDESMIIPRHKVCDFCEKPVGVNKRYFVIKSKDYLVGYAGSCSDNRTHHICEDCMGEFKTYLCSKLKDKENK